MAIKALAAIFLFATFSSGIFAQGSALIVDHTAVDSFASIPGWAISSAAAKTSMLRRASVGGNIDSGLDALQAQDSRYSRQLWQFQNRGNPGWPAKISDFASQASQQAASFDVMAMKFCFIDYAADFEQYRAGMESAEAAAPGKAIVWWTMPTVKGDAHNSQIESFNGKVRAYANSNGKLLFDLADTESHRADGSACNYRGYESLCPEWTSDGGHLTPEASLRAAKAYWYLMARLSGWDGASSSQQPPAVQEPAATTPQPPPVQGTATPQESNGTAGQPSEGKSAGAAEAGQLWQANRPQGQAQAAAPKAPSTLPQSEPKGEMLIVPFIVLFGCAVAITAIFLSRRKPPRPESFLPGEASKPLYSPPSMGQRPPVQPPSSGQA